MASNEHQLIGEAIKAHLDAVVAGNDDANSQYHQTFREKIDAHYFRWLPVFEVDDLRKVTVPIVPSGYQSLGKLSRGGSHQHLLSIDVGLLNKIDNVKQRETRVSELQDLLEEIRNEIMRKQRFAGGQLLSQTNEMFDAEQLDSHGVYQNFYRFQFRVCTIAASV